MKDDSNNLKEAIEIGLRELLYGKCREIFGDDEGRVFEAAMLTYDELRGRILKGYSYSIGQRGPDKELPKDIDGIKARRIIVRTGSGGILLFINEFEKSGIPAALAARDIYVDTDEGEHCLLAVKVIKNDKKK